MMIMGLRSGVLTLAEMWLRVTGVEEGRHAGVDSRLAAAEEVGVMIQTVEGGRSSRLIMQVAQTID